jgi:hypothetical protein
MMDKNMTFEEIETEFNSIVSRITLCKEHKMKIEAELASRRRELKEMIDEATKAGFDPDNLPDDIRKSKEILTTKMQLISADLDHAESILKPIVELIERNK